MKSEITKMLVPAMLALVGALVGSYVSYLNSVRLHRNQTNFDNQRIYYAKLISLKVPWSQVIRTHFEARVKCEYYETRYLVFTQDPDDMSEAKKENERALSLIKDISDYQRQVFETLGMIQVSFKMTKEIESAISDIYNFQSIDVNEFPKSIGPQMQSIQDLEAIKGRSNAELTALIDKNYSAKINTLTSMLKSQVMNLD